MSKKISNKNKSLGNASFTPLHTNTSINIQNNNNTNITSNNVSYKNTKENFASNNINCGNTNNTTNLSKIQSNGYGSSTGYSVKGYKNANNTGNYNSNSNNNYNNKTDINNSPNKTDSNSQISSNKPNAVANQGNKKQNYSTNNKSLEINLNQINNSVKNSRNKSNNHAYANQSILNSTNHNLNNIFSTNYVNNNHNYLYNNPNLIATPQSNFNSTLKFSGTINENSQVANFLKANNPQSLLKAKLENTLNIPNSNNYSSKENHSRSKFNQEILQLAKNNLQFNMHNNSKSPSHFAGYQASTSNSNNNKQNIFHTNVAQLNNNSDSDQIERNLILLNNMKNVPNYSGYLPSKYQNSTFINFSYYKYLF